MSKRELVAVILSNRVYPPESGLYTQLCRSLMRLSVSDLENLKLLMGLKCQQEEQHTDLSPAENFFYLHARFSSGPVKGASIQDRIRCAKQLARAEAWLVAQEGHTVEWKHELNPDYTGINHRGPLFGCIVTVPDAGKESLWNIDLGKEGDPQSAPYARVVVAELALELMPKEE